MRNRVIKNIFSSWGMYSTITIIRFFLTPFFIYKLGDSQYGVWVLILSLIGYMELFNFGLNTANVRYLSKYFEERDHISANEIFNSGLLIFLFLGAGISLLTLSVTPFLGKVFSFMNEGIVYPAVFVIAGLNLALELVFYAFSAILSAKQKYVEVNIITTSLYILRSLAAVVLLLSGFKLLAIVLNQAVFNLLKGLTISLYALKSTPILRIDFGSVKKSAVLTITNFSVYIFIINISRKINLTIGVVVISLFMSPSAVTLFAIANNLITYLQNFVLAVPKVLIPRFSQLDAAKNQDKIREYYLSFTRITLIITIPIVFIFMSYGGLLISLWIGREYAELSGSILRILSVGALFQLSQSTTHSVLKATGLHKELSFLAALESISILILSVILIRPFGLIGLAYAHAIPLSFINLTVVPVFACKKLKINIMDYYTSSLLKSIFGLLPLLLIFYFLKSEMIDSVPMFGLISILMMGVFFLSSYLFTLSIKEKQMVSSFIRLGNSRPS